MGQVLFDDQSQFVQQGRLGLRKARGVIADVCNDSHRLALRMFGEEGLANVHCSALGKEKKSA